MESLVLFARELFVKHVAPYRVMPVEGTNDTHALRDIEDDVRHEVLRSYSGYDRHIEI